MNELKQVKPSEEGRKRFPDTDGYYAGTPCICTFMCTSLCNGRCGCLACHIKYQDELSFHGD